MIPPAEIPAPLALYMDGLRNHDLAKIEGSFAGDIRFVTPARTMESREILSFLAALYRGFPDWKYVNDPPIRTGQGAIGVKWYQGGTHSETLSFPGFPPSHPAKTMACGPTCLFDSRVGRLRSND